MVVIPGSHGAISRKRSPSNEYPDSSQIEGRYESEEELKLTKFDEEEKDPSIPYH